MVRSSLENTGYQSSYSLHIRCSDRIWTGDNSCQVALNANTTGTRPDGDAALQGALAARLAGSAAPFERQLARSHRRPCPCPPTSARPGVPNSRSVTNAGPAIYKVTHNPAVPAA